MEKGKNKAHDIVIECLTQSLILLLQNQKLEDITISELCEKAGISRISFYRNYNKIEDILLNQLNQITDDWWNSYVIDDSTFLNDSFWDELSKQYLSHKDFIMLLYKNNLSYIIKEHVFSRCGPKPEYNLTKKYATSVIAGAIYGFLDEWFLNGLQKTPFDLNMKVAINLYQLMMDHGKEEKEDTKNE